MFFWSIYYFIPPNIKYIKILNQSKQTIKNFFLSLQPHHFFTLFLLIHFSLLLFFSHANYLLLDSISLFLHLFLSILIYLFIFIYFFLYTFFFLFSSFFFTISFFSTVVHMFYLKNTFIKSCFKAWNLKNEIQFFKKIMVMLYICFIWKIHL